MSPYMTVPEVAKLIGCEAWQVRRLYEKKLLPDPLRAGLTRLIARNDVERIKQLLVEVGYLEATAVA